VPPEAETQTEQKPAEGAPPPEKTLTQSEVNAILARERSNLERKFNERIAALEPQAKRAAELEEAARAAEEAKLSATQRAELERKREREGYEAKIKDLDARAQTETQRRHGLMVQHAAASRLGTLAARLFNPEIAEELEGIASSAMRVEVVDGREVVTIRLGTEGDTEPLETGWQKFVDGKLSKFFKAAGGAGAAHGGGGGRGGASEFATLQDLVTARLKSTGR
jgi:hypothetical protein